MTGVYFLFLKKKVVYIGATKCWPNRLAAHRSIVFDSAKILECSEDNLYQYEGRLIAIFGPKQNVRNTGKDRKRRMDLGWVRNNQAQIAPFMENLTNGKTIAKARKGAIPLLTRMKKELNYSPRTNPMDLFFSLRSAYEKIQKEVNPILPN